MTLCKIELTINKYHRRSYCLLDCGYSIVLYWNLLCIIVRCMPLHGEVLLLLLMISQYTQKTYKIMYIELIRQGVLKAEGNKCQQLGDTGKLTR